VKLIDGGNDAGRLYIHPLSLREAQRFVELWHRHRGRVSGCKFAIGAARNSAVVGVVIVGRPVSRHLDDSWTLEVARLCSDGTRNVCSLLLGAAWRASRAMGYKRLITYTLPSEGGASLRAAGFRVIGQTKAQDWHRESRPRVRQAHEIKDIWERAS